MIFIFIKNFIVLLHLFHYHYHKFIESQKWDKRLNEPKPYIFILIPFIVYIKTEDQFSVYYLFCINILYRMKTNNEK